MHSKEKTVVTIDAILYINLEHRTDRNEHLLEQLDQHGWSHIPIERVDAIRDDPPLRGCTKSHIKALEYALSNPLWKSSVLILEDDFTFFTRPPSASSTASLSPFSFSSTTPETLQEILQTLKRSNNNNNGEYDEKEEDKDKDEEESSFFDVFMLAYNHFVAHYESVVVSSGTCCGANTKKRDYELVRMLDAQTASGYLVSRSYIPKLLANLREGLKDMEKHGLNESNYNDQYWKRLMPRGRWYSTVPAFGYQYACHSDNAGHFVDYQC
jgi:hypothetical protein